MSKTVYTFITATQEVMSYWGNEHTYQEDGYYLLDRPRSVMPINNGAQIMFIPLGFSVADRTHFKMPLTNVYVRPEPSDEGQLRDLYVQNVADTDLFVPPEKQLILG